MAKKLFLSVFLLTALGQVLASDNLADKTEMLYSRETNQIIASCKTAKRTTIVTKDLAIGLWIESAAMHDGARFTYVTPNNVVVNFLKAAIIRYEAYLSKK